MSTQPRNIDIEERHVAYIVIIFGVLYFLVRYVFPMF